MRTTTARVFRFGRLPVGARLKLALHFCKQFAQGRFLREQPLDHPHCVTNRRRLAVEGPGDGSRTKPGALAAEIERCHARKRELPGVVVDAEGGAAEYKVVKTHLKEFGNRPLDSIDVGCGGKTDRRFLFLHLQQL